MSLSRMASLFFRLRPSKFVVTHEFIYSSKQWAKKNKQRRRVVFVPVNFEISNCTKQMSASTKGIVNQNRNRRVVIAIHAFNGTLRRWQWEDDLLHFSTISSPAPWPFVLPPNYRTIAGRMVLSLSRHERDSSFCLRLPSLTAAKGKEKRTNNAWNCHKWSRFSLPFIKLLLLEAVSPFTRALERWFACY